MKTIVIALGGNALLSPSGNQSFSMENSNIRRISKDIAKLCKNAKYNVVITHGNGSQVGDELMRNEHSKRYMSKLPLYAINSETQALIGTMIETALRNELGAAKLNRDVCVILSHILVGEGDPAFKKPSKPIGPFYTRKELENELKLDSFDYIKTVYGYRRVVASPQPKSILEIKSIREAVGKNIVITCGGGGVPTVKKGMVFSGVDAVIDKDRTAQLLATLIGADTIVILTDADCLYLDYEKKTGKIKEIRAGEIKRKVGRFEDGTIRPKIEACVKFIESGGKEAYIGNLFKLDLILKHASGTRIH